MLGHRSMLLRTSLGALWLFAAVRLKLADNGKSSPPPSDLPRTFTLWERAQLFLISWIGYLAVLVIGRSLRWETFGRENYEAAERQAKGIIFTLWHCQIFPSTWYWRKLGIVVMASQNFDGEYTARVIRRHGYGAVRGSSSRQGSRALVEMIRAAREGSLVALTVDGPRGPRFVAKPGVVQLARHSGAGILCFHSASRKAWVLRKSWDRTEIPRPFSRAAMFIAPLTIVAPDASDAEQASKLQEVQRTLDELVRRGEAWKHGA